jgi:hypothetical protein
LHVVAAGVLAAGSAHADLTASYDGTLANAVIAGALTQNGVAARTLAVQAADPSLAGVYWVGGQLRGKRLTVTGANAAGMRSAGGRS